MRINDNPNCSPRALANGTTKVARILGGEEKQELDVVVVGKVEILTRSFQCKVRLNEPETRSMLVGQFLGLLPFGESKYCIESRPQKTSPTRRNKRMFKSSK